MRRAGFSLVTDADGTSQREAFRRFLTTAVSQPVADLVAEELSAQAGPCRCGSGSRASTPMTWRDGRPRSRSWRAEVWPSSRRWRCLGPGGAGMSGGGVIERAAPVEVRMAGRTLSGVVLRYGERSVDRAELFEAGAFAPIGEVSLNLQHDRSRVDRLHLGG